MNLALSEKRSNHDTTKETDGRAKDEQKDSKSRSDFVLPAVQVEREVQKKMERESICNKEYETERLGGSL